MATQPRDRIRAKHLMKVSRKPSRKALKESKEASFWNYANHDCYWFLGIRW